MRYKLLLLYDCYDWSTKIQEAISSYFGLSSEMSWKLFLLYDCYDCSPRSYNFIFRFILRNELETSPFVRLLWLVPQEATSSYFGLSSAMRCKLLLLYDCYDWSPKKLQVHISVYPQQWDINFSFCMIAMIGPPRFKKLQVHISVYPQQWDVNFSFCMIAMIGPPRFKKLQVHISVYPQLWDVNFSFCMIAMIGPPRSYKFIFRFILSNEI